jgi:soluble lytic murein transglycosylase-like protein
MGWFVCVHVGWKGPAWAGCGWCVNTNSVRSAGTPPAFLPLRQTGGSGFSQSLRAQIRAEVTNAIADGLSEPSALAVMQGKTIAKSSALQQSLLTRSTSSRPAPTGQWADLTKSIGSQYLSPQVAEVFTRQIALESANFDPAVINGQRVSSAGAQGIAQLMPSSYPNVNRLDPVASLHAAGQTMKANLQQYNGDLRKALAAYNAGGGTVSGLVARYGANWEQGLPHETQIYLREILGGANV